MGVMRGVWLSVMRGVWLSGCDERGVVKCDERVWLSGCDERGVVKCDERVWLSGCNERGVVRVGGVGSVSLFPPLLAPHQLGAELQAHAVSHLEHISDEGMQAMAQVGCVGILLPTTAYILRLRPPPARKMIERGEVCVCMCLFSFINCFINLYYKIQFGKTSWEFTNRVC